MPPPPPNGAQCQQPRPASHFANKTPVDCCRTADGALRKIIEDIDRSVGFQKRMRDDFEALGMQEQLKIMNQSLKNIEALFKLANDYVEAFALGTRGDYRKIQG